MRINLAEVRAISGSSQYNWSKSHEANRKLEERKVGILSYLKVLTGISQKSLQAAKTAIFVDIEERGDFVGKRDFIEWGFDDFEALLNRASNSSLSRIGRHYTGALRGHMQTAQLK